MKEKWAKRKMNALLRKGLDVYWVDKPYDRELDKTSQLLMTSDLYAKVRWENSQFSSLHFNAFPSRFVIYVAHG